MGSAAGQEPGRELPAAIRRLIERPRRELRVRRGRTIVSVGARQDYVLVLREGEAQIVLHSASGREVSIRNLGPGDVIGDLAAIDGLPRAASVVASSDTRLAVLTRDEFLACLEGPPAAALWLARRLAAEVRRLTERVFELSALNVQARLHCELLRLARLRQPGPLIIAPAPTHAELASRIGTHREAVTRALRALADRNIVRSGRRALEILDLGALERAIIEEVGGLDERRLTG